MRHSMFSMNSKVLFKSSQKYFLIMLLLSLSQGIYGASFSVSPAPLTVAVDRLTDSDYTVKLYTAQPSQNGNVSPLEVRYCVDADIRHNFQYTLSLSKGHWGGTLTSSSLLIEHNGISFPTTTLLSGGTTRDSDVTFLIQASEVAIFNGACLVLKDFAVTIPQTTVKTEDVIKIEARLYDFQSNVDFNPALSDVLINLSLASTDSQGNINSTNLPPNDAFGNTNTGISDTPIIIPNIPPLSEGSVPRFSSRPEPDSIIEFGNSELGNPSSVFLTILEMGDATLNISRSDIEGEHAGDFSITRGAAPISLANGAPAHTLFLQCLPKAPGERYAQLVLQTNDSNQPRVRYTLKCVGSGEGELSTTTGFHSIPKPEQPLIFNPTPLGMVSDAIVTISATNNQLIEIKEIILSETDDFQLPQITLPVKLFGGESYRLNIQCSPKVIGERQAQLMLVTNDVQYATVIYSLSCEGISAEEPGAVEKNYSSIPKANTPLVFNPTPIGMVSEATLTITRNGGNFEIQSVSLFGEDVDEFHLIDTSVPIILNDEVPNYRLTLQCAPRVVGKRTAQLTVFTNVQANATISYPLICEGQEANNDASFISTLQPNSRLDLGTTTVGVPLTITITVTASGKDTLHVYSATFTGEQVGDFSIISGMPPFSIAAGEAPQPMVIQCLPHEVGERSALLTLKTNDPHLPQIGYSISCIGKNPLQDVSFDGQIVTAAGAVGKNLRINALEKIKVIGYVKPGYLHLHQMADLILFLHWTPYGNDKTQLFKIPLGSWQLTDSMTIPIFAGNLIGFAGSFVVELGYRLPNGEFYSGKIVTSEVRPNHAPTDIFLDGNSVAENSEPSTKIGILSTSDADDGEWFMYGLMTNPGRYFTIVGNELQVARGFNLDYESAKQHTLTIRSVDSSGDFIDKTFTIQVTDINEESVSQLPLQGIRLTNNRVVEESVANTVVGRFATDSWTSGTFRYDLLADAHQRFKIKDDLLLVAQGGKQLDMEAQATYDITVRSTEVASQQTVEETFTIELTNVPDIDAYSEIFTVNDEPTLPTVDQAIKLRVHLIPDFSHHDWQAEIASIAFWWQNGVIAGSYALSEQGWQIWNGNLDTLPTFQQVTLMSQHEFTLLEGSLPGGFANSELEIRMGYRLIETGDVVVSEPITIEVLE